MKKKLSKFKSFLLSVVKHPSLFLFFLKSMKDEEVFENEKHIKLASGWLIKAQNIGEDNGYSRGFYLYKDGWDKSYIETTGYIIPTMLEVSRYLKNEIYFESACKAGLWLLSVQNDNGSFSGIDNGVELVFDTGQVLYGLVALYEEERIDEIDKKLYFESFNKASKWLCDVQDSDGSWSQYGYNQLGHTYYS